MLKFLSSIRNEYDSKSISASEYEALLNFLLYNVMEKSMLQSKSINIESTIEHFFDQVKNTPSCETGFFIHYILNDLNRLISQQDKEKGKLNNTNNVCYIITQYIKLILKESLDTYDTKKEQINDQYLTKDDIICKFDLFSILDTDNFSKLLNTNVNVLDKMDNNCSDAQKYFSQNCINNVKLYVYNYIKNQLYANKEVETKLAELINNYKYILLSTIKSNSKKLERIKKICDDLKEACLYIFSQWKGDLVNRLMPGKTKRLRMYLVDEPMAYAIEQYVYQKFFEAVSKSDKLAEEIVENIRCRRLNEKFGLLNNIASKYVIADYIFELLDKKRINQLFINEKDEDYYWETCVQKNNDRLRAHMRAMNKMYDDMLNPKTNYSKDLFGNNDSQNVNNSIASNKQLIKNKNSTNIKNINSKSRTLKPPRRKKKMKKNMNSNNGINEIHTNINNDEIKTNSSLINNTNIINTNTNNSMVNDPMNYVANDEDMYEKLDKLYNQQENKEEEEDKKEVKDNNNQNSINKKEDEKDKPNAFLEEID